MPMPTVVVVIVILRTSIALHSNSAAAGRHVLLDATLLENPQQHSHNGQHCQAAVQPALGHVATHVIAAPSL